MSRTRIKHPSGRRRSIAPQLEPLETRQLLAAKAAAHVTFTETSEGTSSGLYDLRIVGTSKNDLISINDDGKQAAGSLRVSTASGLAYISQHPINFIQVVTGAGKDTFAYVLQGDLQSKVQETLFASSGGTPFGSINASKGGGTLKASVTILGKIPDGSALTAAIGTDSKAATALSVSDLGPINGTFATGIANLATMSSKAKAGPVSFNLNSSATVGATGKLSIIGVGGSSRNTMNASYSGMNNGNLNVLEQGAGAKDNLAADVSMVAGSTGTVGNSTPSQVGSTGSGAKVRFTIHRGADSTSKTGIAAQVTMSAKKSTIAHTANVQDLAIGTEMIIP